MLVERSLRGHAVVMGLAIHALSERPVAGCSLSIASELVHVVGIVWATVVGVVVWVTGAVSVLRMLALCTVSLASHSCWVRGVVAAVLSIAVSAL